MNKKLSAKNSEVSRRDFIKNISRGRSGDSIVRHADGFRPARKEDAGLPIGLWRPRQGRLEKLPGGG